LWTRFWQLRGSISTLNDGLIKTPQNSFSSSVTTRTRLKAPLSSSTVVQNNAAPPPEEVRVDMADMKVESRPVVLVTNVGSCVAICIHDSINKRGGLAHIMLPSSKIACNNSLPSKYADTAVPELAKALRRSGKSSVSLSAKIAGGANMFPNLGSSALHIGLNNVEAVKQALAANQIKLVAEDVRGSYGRRISFNIVNGSMCVRSGNGDVKEF
jgi:chemotaxis protein CheD